MKKLTYLLPILISLTITGCSISFSQSSNGSNQKLSKKINSGALVIDVRSVDEFSSGHVDGALNIPYDQLQERLAELGSDLEREIILYCRSGRRAEFAKRILEENGFKNVSNVGEYSDLSISLGS